jgi:hypothetical protein
MARANITGRAALVGGGHLPPEGPCRTNRGGRSLVGGLTVTTEFLLARRLAVPPASGLLVRRSTNIYQF